MLRGVTDTDPPAKLEEEQHREEQRNRDPGRKSREVLEQHETTAQYSSKYR
jgi:hypothetical protein